MTAGGRVRRRRFARAFGVVLREYRMRAGISQEELAELGDFDRTFPSLLERGMRTPTLTVFCAIAEALAVAPAELIIATVERARAMGTVDAGCGGTTHYRGIVERSRRRCDTQWRLSFKRIKLLNDFSGKNTSHN
jgi:transcriptional regulator with XRE-family HTH domain